MTAGELFNIFKQYNIPNDAKLMSDSGWEAWATDMDGIYYNKKSKMVIFTQEISDCDTYFWSIDWIKCKKEGGSDGKD